jgi:hypothetical protein
MMRTLLYRCLIVMGILGVPVILSPSQQRQISIRDFRLDPRWRLLQRFFAKTDCPARRYTAVFLDAADRNDLDWRLLPSISYVESTGGKFANNNNLFGWDSGRARFRSPIESIQHVGYQLGHSDLYKDKDLDSLLATYNPSTEYAHRVKSVMRQIAPAE